MYIFIINPIAGNGRAKKIHVKLLKDPEYVQLNPIYYYTEYSGHAEIIAAEIKETIDGQLVEGIVIIGGDGTLHEVMNGMKLHDVPISFIPGGSGNDFARGFRLKKDPKETLYAIKNNVKTLDYWLGVYETNQIKDNYFVNCIGFGFDAVVAASANNSRYKRLFNRLYLSPIIYLFSLLKELLFYKPVSITVEMDGVEREFSQCLLFTVNNHPYIGGGMKVNPLAENNKDDYSIIVIDSISKWKVLVLFSTVFTGRHLRFKEVSTFKARQIKIQATEPVPYQVDGETSSTMKCSIKKTANPTIIKGASID